MKIVSFSRLLTEKAMNMKTYSDVISRLNNDALIGFEFEVVVKPYSELFVSSEESRFTEDISDYDWDDLISSRSNLGEYFDISSRDRAYIEDDYNEWLNDEAEEWATQNYEDFRQDNDESEEDLVERAKDSFIQDSDKRRHPGHIDNFVDYRGGIIGILRHHNLEPVHGWHSDTEFYTSEDSDEPAFEGIAENCARSLTRFGIETRFGDPGPNYTTWGITSDGSLPADHDMGQGIEIISKPLPPTEAIKHLNRFFDWMEDVDITTTEECGLHINISVSEMAENLDPFKLALFMGEEYMLAEFKRTNSVYTKPMLDSIFSQLSNTGVVPKLPKEMLDLSLSIINKSIAKYKTANLSKLKDHGYIEFRIAGGANYHKDAQKIILAIGRYLTIIELACDPHAERQEYMKKIAKLSSLVRYKISGSSKIDAEDFISINFTRFLNASNSERFTSMTKQLSRLYNDLRSDSDLSDFDRNTTISHIVILFVNIVSELIASSIKLSLPFTVKELVAIRALAKQLDIKLSDIPQHISDVGIRERFKKDMRL